ncbi:hypothetical protein E2C01_053395 [Portunus trituberculatus]|uniref:Uncharacterized protein n=1 Tax=Portunus trituberculatus TaxID=210409 RepID=A0A5B7GPB6_PORTR|nr:hypothetical protein [Portunus trituberculatus]
MFLVKFQIETIGLERLLGTFTMSQYSTINTTSKMRVGQAPAYRGQRPKNSCGNEDFEPPSGRSFFPMVFNVYTCYWCLKAVSGP